LLLLIEAVTANVIPDYISLLETRLVLTIMNRVGNPVAVIVLLLLDGLVTFLTAVVFAGFSYDASVRMNMDSTDPAAGCGHARGVARPPRDGSPASYGPRPACEVGRSIRRRISDGTGAAGP
jgi:hypothetical protein